MADPTLDPAQAAAVEQGLQRLAGLARDAGSREVPEAWRERMLARVERRSTRRGAPGAIPAHRTRSPARLRAFALVAASLILVLAIAGVAWRRPEAPLAYAIDNVPSASSYVRGGPDGAVARFGDGTVIGFAPGARGRVVAITAHGARLSVDEGKAHFRVVHRPGAEWTVEAGPFTIAVTGTEFDVTWQGEHLDLVMQTGTVSVRGPLTPQGVDLHGGQHLAVDVARGELTIAESSLVTGASAAPPPLEPSTPTSVDSPEPAPDPAPAPSARPAADALPPSPRPAPSAPPPARPPEKPPPSFRERVARGDFAAVITEAEALGVDSVIDSGSLADIAALADAARYAGKDDLARRALLAERSRFAGSPEARSAAFLLGRMAQATSPATAVAWYDSYLTESPEGSLAPEALGRKMVAVKASSSAAASRPIAKEYLRRYPRGAFAQAAEEILARP
jgi:ferric-dicitrate binding protein FerR (iron transport regulator)